MSDPVPLRRDPSLTAFSREHHHALALCVRILRDPQADHLPQIAEHTPELLAHFAEEEMRFAPYWPQLDAALRMRFEQDHADLRAMLAAPEATEVWQTGFAQTLRGHVRFEERELFAALQPCLAV